MRRILLVRSKLIQKSIEYSAQRPDKFLTRSDLGPLASILLVALLFGLPLLWFGPYQDGHDTAEHINFTGYFAEQFWKGELYPRWLVDMNTGLGSPSYFVYPSLPAFVFILVQPIAGILRLNAFSLAAWLPLLGSGFAAYIWLRTDAKRLVATLCAVLYMSMPYTCTSTCIADAQFLRPGHLYGCLCYCTLCTAL